jgi:hypothetical protein
MTHNDFRHFVKNPFSTICLSTDISVVAYEVLLPKTSTLALYIQKISRAKDAPFLIKIEASLNLNHLLLWEITGF